MTIAFGKKAEGNEGLSDGDFLKELRWDREAPPKVVEAVAEGRVAEFATRLQTDLLPRLKHKHLERHADPLWSRTAFPTDPRSEELIALWTRIAAIETGAGKKADRVHASLSEWLDASQGAGPIDLLVFLEWLTRFGREMPPETCLKLWRATLAGAFVLHHVQTEENGPADHELVLRGELPYRCGVLFAAVDGMRELQTNGRDFMQRALVEHVDSTGMPDAELLERLQFWIAPLTRAALDADRHKATLWNDDAAKRFRKLARTAAAMCGRDKRLAMTNGRAGKALGLVAASARAAGWKKKSAPLTFLAGIERGRSEVSKRQRHKHTSMQSDEAEFAVLRSSWANDADGIVVTHHAPMPTLELVARGELLIAGQWGLELAIDGDAINVGGEWECVCWHSDSDADYLEIQRSLGEGLQVERQILLSRTGRFAIFADAVHGAGAARISACSRLPLASAGSAEPDLATRELRVRAGNASARAFALNLPDERVHSASGSFQFDDGAIELRQQAVSGLFAPVILDWAPERRKSYADWRSLTVTEDGKILSSDVAAACRLRLGSHQVLVYRALQKCEDPRAVLGLHSANETVIGLVDSGGTVNPILLVE